MQNISKLIEEMKNKLIEIILKDLGTTKLRSIEEENEKGIIMGSNGKWQLLHCHAMMAKY